MSKKKVEADPTAERSREELEAWKAQKRREGCRVRHVRPPRPGGQPDFRFK